MKAYIDLSHPVNNHTPAYPGDEHLHIEQTSGYDQKGYSDFRLTTTMHTGTHIDGPMHMTSSRQFIGDIFIDRLTGTGCILDVQGEKEIGCKAEYGSRIPADSIVVIYTGFGKKYGTDQYFTEYPVISIKLVDLLIEKRIKMLCLDTPSPDNPPHSAHSLLLKNHILIAENLANVDRLPKSGDFEIIALPLRLHTDSSPARIIARVES